MGIMNQRWMATLTAAAFMITASPFEANAQQSRVDDWLGFDQSGNSWDHSTRDRASAREPEVQPERGFPTLAKENVTATRNAIKQYAEIVARGGWAQLPPISCARGCTTPRWCSFASACRRRAICRPMAAIRKFSNSCVENAVKKAQTRHGLPATGSLRQEYDRRA